MYIILLYIYVYMYMMLYEVCYMMLHLKWCFRDLRQPMALQSGSCVGFD